MYSRKMTRRRLVGLTVPAVAFVVAACSQAPASSPTAAPANPTSAPASAPTTAANPTSAPASAPTTAANPTAAPANPTSAPASAPTAAKPTVAPAAQAAPASGSKKFSFQSFTGGSQDTLWNGYNFSTWRKQFPDIQIDFSWFSYGAYKDKMPAQIATGDIPDVMMVNAINDIPLLRANNMIIPITDYLKSDGQDLLKRTPPDYFSTATYQGQQMYMPATWNPNLWISTVRSDWLTKLSLSVPTTLADYETALNAFTNKDPDGNGKKDTYGYEINTAFYFDDFLFHAFGVAVGHHHNTFWRKRGNQIENDWVQPGMKDALAWLVGIWNKGYFAPTSVTGDITSHTDFLGGKTGFSYSTGSSVYETATSLQAVAKGAQIAAIPPPKGPGGQNSSGEGMQWGYVISKKAQFPADAVRMINWQFTPDGWNKLCAGDAGVPGLTIKGFTPEGYFIRYTPEEQAQIPDWSDRVQKAGDQTLYMNIRYQNDAFWKDVPDAMTKYYADQLTKTTPQQDIDGTAVAKKYTLVSLKQAPVPSDQKFFPTLQTKFMEVLSQLGTGAAPIESGWSEWLDFWNKNGGPQITQEVNQAATG